MPCGFSISPTPQSHFGLIAEALEQQGYPLPVHWVPHQCHDLKQHGPADVLERLRSLPATEASRVASALFRETGSADAVSHLSCRRMAHWVRHGREWQQSGDANTAQRGSRCAGHRPMSIRCWHYAPPFAMTAGTKPGNRCGSFTTNAVSPAVYNVPLTDVWPSSSFLLLALVRVRPDLALPCSSLPRHSPPPATLPGSCRPSPHHPWKRLPACRPTLAAKI